MTRSRYGTAVILQSFGFYRKTKRMTDAATEVHLMQEGEEILGILCWQNIENIEDLSMEYWNIRKINGELVELDESIITAEQTLHAAQQERANLVDQNKDIGQGLFNEREALFDDMETFSISRDEIMEEAGAVKRRFEALKLKIGVLKEEKRTDEPGYQETAEEILELREHFKKLKIKLDEIDALIDEKQLELQKLQQIIDETNKDNKSNASEIYALISRANREISSNRAKVGALIEEKARLCRQVGRHLNIHQRERACRAACKDHRNLLDQVNLLRQSITWNKKLITLAGG